MTILSHRKAWLEKKKALVMAFDDWEQTYNNISRWLEVVKEKKYGDNCALYYSPCMVDGVQNISCYTLDHVFWSFKSCIDGFIFLQVYCTS